MQKDLQKIIVSGASGFIGRYVIEAIKERFIIYALARRSQKQVGIDPHPNIKWIQVDIGDWDSLKRIMFNIKKQGGVDYILHLAAYYDFSCRENTEYKRTNINGTRHMLEQAKWLCVKHFIFISSLTVSKFPEPGKKLNEQSPPNAEFPYARSKGLGEEMASKYVHWFSISIVRLAAVFSDWCEYGPLYHFLNTWVSKKWNARILGGHGESAITYIHINDFIGLILKIINKSCSNPSIDYYIASSNDSINHRKLFEIVTRYYFGKTIKPIYMPKIFAYLGVPVRNLWGHIIGRVPFERLWMLKYVDKKLEVDSSYTQKVLSWKPIPRYRLERRLLFLIERMKSNPDEWHTKNEAAIKHVMSRPNLILYQCLIEIKDEAISKYIDYLLSPENYQKFKHYQQMDKDSLIWSINIIYQLLAAAVRIGDRMLLLNYINDLVIIHYQEGFRYPEDYHAFSGLNDIITSMLSSKSELRNMKDHIYDYISLTIQLALDEIEDHFEHIKQQIPKKPIEISTSVSSSSDFTKLENLIKQLEVFYLPSTDEMNQKT